MKLKTATFSTILTLLLATSIISVVIAAPPAGVTTGQPDFEANIEISGNLNINLGQTTTLTANWETNRDVNREKWSIGDIGQGEVEIAGASEGTSTFEFTPTEGGEYEISYRIWHHNPNQDDRDATESVTVIVTEDVEYNYETAFAYGGEFANDFRDHSFSRWGWSNGPLGPGEYEFGLWAGAGQSDLSKGTHVGTVSITYENGDFQVDVELFDSYVFGLNDEGEDDIKIYAGTEMFPKNNDASTVAPGHYYIQEPLEDEIYVIVHVNVGIPEV